MTCTILDGIRMLYNFSLKNIEQQITMPTNVLKLHGLRLISFFVVYINENNIYVTAKSTNFEIRII